MILGNAQRNIVNISLEIFFGGLLQLINHAENILWNKNN